MPGAAGDGGGGGGGEGVEGEGAIQAVKCNASLEL